MWKVEFTPAARLDFSALTKSNQLQVIRAIEKVLTNRLPDYRGGYGKPLGNKNNLNLSGYLKIKLKKAGLRVVYSLVEEKEHMIIIVISVRDDDLVYRLAAKRINNS